MRLALDFFRLSCKDQYIQVRDGDSSASNLIFQFAGGNYEKSGSKNLISSGSDLLIEFVSNDYDTATRCIGGFIGHIRPIRSYQSIL